MTDALVSKWRQIAPRAPVKERSLCKLLVSSSVTNYSFLSSKNDFFYFELKPFSYSCGLFKTMTLYLGGGGGRRPRCHSKDAGTWWPSCWNPTWTTGTREFFTKHQKQSYFSEELLASKEQNKLLNPLARTPRHQLKTLLSTFKKIPAIAVKALPVIVLKTKHKN